jgi:hypothetical protein
MSFGCGQETDTKRTVCSFHCVEDGVSVEFVAGNRRLIDLELKGIRRIVAYIGCALDLTTN